MRIWNQSSLCKKTRLFWFTIEKKIFLICKSQGRYLIILKYSRRWIQKLLEWLKIVYLQQTASKCDLTALHQPSLVFVVCLPRVLIHMYIYINAAASLRVALPTHRGGGARCLVDHWIYMHGICSTEYFSKYGKELFFFNFKISSYTLLINWTKFFYSKLLGIF